jgi:hypothetical protein
MLHAASRSLPKRIGTTDYALAEVLVRRRSGAICPHLSFHPHLISDAISVGKFTEPQTVFEHTYNDTVVSRNLDHVAQTTSQHARLLTVLPMMII